MKPYVRGDGAEPGARVRIVHLIDHLSVGGTEMTLCKLIAHMDRSRFENIIISMLPLAGIAPDFHDLGVPLLALNMRRGSLSGAAFVKLLGILRRERPHVLQSWGYAANCVAAVAGALLRARNVVWNVRRRPRTIAGDCSRATALAGRCAPALSALPRVVVACSETILREHMVIGYRPRRTLLIPNGFDLDRFRPDPEARAATRRLLGVANDALVIGMFARFHPLKDHATFFEASALLARARRDAHFVLCGAAMVPGDPRVAAWLSAHPAPERVHLLGERSDVHRLYAGLDVFTLTSLSEGFPNVVGEAMACGVPCVVSDASGEGPEVVADTGLVFPVGQAPSLADAWARLGERDTGRRRRLSLAARQRIERLYSLAESVAKYQDLYRSLAFASA